MSSAPSATPRGFVRSPRRVNYERALLLALGTCSVVLAATYTIGLVYLVARGGVRVFSFTLYPTPENGIQGETTARALLAAAFGAGLGSALRGLLGWLAVTLGPRLPMAAGLERWTRHGWGRSLPLGFALAAALFLRDHLPRFLINLPSEIRAGGGVGPELFNTLYFAFLSTAATTPIGIGAALYLAKFARSRRFTQSLRIALDTLASLPSIVYGLFGFLVFVVALRTGYSLVAGAAVLALLNVPLVVGIAEESIRAVPRELEDASLALGATRIQTALRVTLPGAWPGILGALVLSVGRVFAESAPLIMTAGTTISRTNAFSFDPMRGGETLAVHLWYVNSAGLAPDRAEVSAGTAAVLVLLVAATNLLASRLAGLGGPKGKRIRRATTLLRTGPDIPPAPSTR